MDSAKHGCSGSQGRGARRLHQLMPYVALDPHFAKAGPGGRASVRFRSSYPRHGGERPAQGRRPSLESRYLRGFFRFRLFPRAPLPGEEGWGSGQGAILDQRLF